MSFDLLLTGGHLSDGARADVGISADRIAAMAPRLEAEAGETIDVSDCLLAPPFVDPHFHMDATLSYGLPRINASGTLLEGIALWGELKPILTHDAVVDRAFVEAFEAGHRAALDVAAHAPSVYTYPLGGRGAHTFVLKTLGHERAYIDPGLNVRVLEYGTTATVALVQGRGVAVANVGDSLATLGSEQDGAYHVRLLTRRHWGGDAGERARLERDFGRLVRLEDEDGYLTVNEGRLSGYQLAMTRALGHCVLSQYGVIPRPSVQRHTLSRDDLCLILASDGVWETCSPSEAVVCLCDLLAQGQSVPEAALELARSAVELSTAASPDIGADNTTVAVFVFDDILEDDGAGGAAEASQDGAAAGGVYSQLGLPSHDTAALLAAPIASS